jgi:hypothetical protein
VGVDLAIRFTGRMDMALIVPVADSAYVEISRRFVQVATGSRCCERS